MAGPRICEVEGCGKDVKACGFCNAHYTRWYRHGDPCAGRTAPGIAQAFVEKAIQCTDADKCLIWPFARTVSGYAMGNPSGFHSSIVSRHVCIVVHGEPPVSGLQAAHSCGNGHLGCVNPMHLRWATTSENLSESYDHGTRFRGERNPTSKLSDAAVEEIRSVPGYRGIFERLGEKFGVDPSHISAIRSGKARKHG